MYNVPFTNVVVEEKPKLCDWERAPLGDKGCHYKAVVTRWSKSTEGKPIVSYDGGKRWQLIQPPLQEPIKLPLIVVGWKKVEDD